MKSLFLSLFPLIASCSSKPQQSNPEPTSPPSRPSGLTKVAQHTRDELNNELCHYIAKVIYLHRNVQCNRLN